jgi:dTDP-4-amino-4,6-dideoxygalactose transaminase
MIPRVKVNYRWADLFRSVFLRGPGDPHTELSSWLAAYQGSRHVLLTPSGRAGLYFLLRTTPRCRVVLPAYTCKAVVEATRMAGKEISFLDAESSGFNAALDGLEQLANPDTLFVATHQFGFPCDIVRAVELCHRRGALVIEDCAACLGTRICGRLAGTFGDAAFFSFDSTKLINVPLKAGFVTMQSPEWFAELQAVFARDVGPMPLLHQLCLFLLGAAYLVLENPLCYRLFHWLTLRKRFTADTSGVSLERTPFYRYHVTPWQAWLALRQLGGLEQIIARRRELHSAYQQGLAGCRSLQLPPNDERGEWSSIRFPVLAGRDKLAWYRAANRRGVDFAFSFTFLACPETFTRAHAVARAILDLPFYTKLTDAEVRKVVTVLRELDASFST